MKKETDDAMTAHFIGFSAKLNYVEYLSVIYIHIQSSLHSSPGWAAQWGLQRYFRNASQSGRSETEDECMSNRVKTSLGNQVPVTLPLTFAVIIHAVPEKIVLDTGGPSCLSL